MRSAPDSPTIKQVAERAGVSTATVSRVLSGGGGGVRRELIAKVRQAVSSLDYQPNRVARNLRVRTTKTVGLIISDIQNPFFTSVVRGVEDVIHRAGFTLLLANTDDDQNREEIYLTTLREESVAGLIFVTGNGQSEGFRRLQAARIPLVAIDRVPAGLSVDQVVVANAEGAREATEQFLRKGHRRIGFIGGPPHLNTASERQSGYEQALKTAGVRLTRELIVHGNFRQEGGYQAMRQLLALSQPPTAVFVSNNLMALGALRAIHERNLLIPTEMGVISFDDMPWATSIQPPLTAVAQPTYELGSSAAELLLARMREPDRPIRRIVLQTQLMIRASCG
ncbi:MAG TPA: LacI family DNA-binding transcriptional regulator [Pyrinomonadaceae bacterium]|nr:LacI family DNA-binding transcriptional regulator [Pyrinomonadaceae bacterium]